MTTGALVSNKANHPLKGSSMSHPGGYLMKGLRFHSCQPSLIYMLIYSLITYVCVLLIYSFKVMITGLHFSYFN